MDHTLPPDHHILARDLAFPEGPAFAPDGALWCVELKAETLVRIEHGQVQRIHVGGGPNGIAFDRSGTLWFCDSAQDAIRTYDVASGICETVASASAAHDLRGPNDLAFAGDGSLVFTCPGTSRQEPTGMVWRLSRERKLTLVAEGLYFPNGLAFTEGSKQLVVAETYRHRLWRGLWNCDRGRWVDPKPYAELGGPVGPDGMALGGDGRMRVAVYGQQAVKIVGDSGDIDVVIATPGRNPTNCAFDPTGRLGLVVTEAERGEIIAYPNVGSGAPLNG
jgi:gluconolactonase